MYCVVSRHRSAHSILANEPFLVFLLLALVVNFTVLFVYSFCLVLEWWLFIRSALFAPELEYFNHVYFSLPL